MTEKTPVTITNGYASDHALCLDDSQIWLNVSMEINLESRSSEPHDNHGNLTQDHPFRMGGQLRPLWIHDVHAT